MIAYESCVRPLLEYCSPVWFPYFIKDIVLIENVQKYFSRIILRYPKLNYADRLRLLKLESLEERRIKADIIECFKHTNNLSKNKEIIFAPSKNRFNFKGDLYEQYARTDMRKYWFENRTIRLWNHLSNDTKKLKSFTAFKNKIKNTDLSAFCRGPDLHGR